MNYGMSEGPESGFALGDDATAAAASTATTAALAPVLGPAAPVAGAASGGFFKKLFGGGKKDSEAEEARAQAEHQAIMDQWARDNAKAVNMQRDAIINSTTFKNYERAGLIADPSAYKPPVADAFGNTKEALQRIVMAIDEMKKITRGQRLYQKWESNFPQDPLGPALGPGNVPEAMWRFDDIWRKIGEWEAGAGNAPAAAPGGNVSLSPVQIGVPRTGVPASALVTTKVSQPSRGVAQPSSLIESVKSMFSPSQPVQQAPGYPSRVETSPATFGPSTEGYALRDAVAQEPLGPAAASAVGEREMIVKVLGIAGGLLLVGFLISPKRAPVQSNPCGRRYRRRR